MKLKLLILIIATGISALAIANKDYPHLAKAHSSYAKGDFKDMTLSLRDALAEHKNDPMVVDNAVQVLAQARIISGSAGIPTDWQLPDGVHKLVYAVVYRTGHKKKYMPQVIVKTEMGVEVRNLTLTRFPDEVLIDQVRDPGKTESGREENEGREIIKTRLKGNWSKEKIPAGLYLIKFDLTDGTNVNGWFIADEKLNATAGPSIRAPYSGQVFNHGRPKVRIRHFQSPESSADEFRTMWLAVGAFPPSNEWETKYSTWRYPASDTEFVIGDNKNAVGVNNLDDGRYIAVVGFSESSKFGPMVLSRRARSHRLFHVKRN